MKKFLRMVACVFAAGLLAFCMASCANDSGESGSSGGSGNDDAGALAVYEYSDSYEAEITEGMVRLWELDSSDIGKTYKRVITGVVRFYENTFTAKETEKETVDGTEIDSDSEEYKGTYELKSGDFKNGEISWQATYEDGDKIPEGYLSAYKSSFIISNGVFTEGMLLHFHEYKLKNSDNDSENTNSSENDSENENSEESETSLVGFYNATSATLNGNEGIDQSNTLTLGLGETTFRLIPEGSNMLEIFGSEVRGYYSVSGSAISVELIGDFEGDTLTGTISSDGKTITFTSQTIKGNYLSATFKRMEF